MSSVSWKGVTGLRFVSVGNDTFGRVATAATPVLIICDAKIKLLHIGIPTWTADIDILMPAGIVGTK